MAARNSYSWFCDGFQANHAWIGVIIPPIVFLRYLPESPGEDFLVKVDIIGHRRSPVQIRQIRGQLKPTRACPFDEFGLFLYGMFFYMLKLKLRDLLLYVRMFSRSRFVCFRKVSKLPSLFFL